MAKGLKKKYIKAAKGDFKKAWTLQKKAKGGKTSKSNPKGGKSTAKGYKRKKAFKVRMVPTGIAVNAAYQMGFIDAAQKVMVGDIAGAGDSIRAASGDPMNWMQTAIPAAVAGICKKAVGEIKLIDTDGFKLTLF